MVVIVVVNLIDGMKSTFLIKITIGFYSEKKNKSMQQNYQ